MISEVFSPIDPPQIVWTVEYGTFFYDARETSTHDFIVAGRKYYSDYARTVFLYDSDGNLVWETGIPGLLTTTYSYWVDEDWEGNFIAACSGRDSISADKSIYLLCVDPLGSLTWWEKYDFEGSHDIPYCVLPISGDRYAVCGEIDPVAPDHVQSFLMVTDSQGDSLWTTVLEKGYSNRAHRVVEYEDQLVVFIHGGDAGIRLVSFDSGTGDILWEADDFPDSFDYGNLGGDMTLSTTGYGFAFVTSGWPKLAHTDELGNLEWYVELPNWSQPYGHSVSSTMDSGYIYGGENTPGTPPYGIQSGMVAKLDSIGNLQWADIVYEAHDIQSIRQISSGGYIACGGILPEHCCDMNPKKDLWKGSCLSRYCFQNRLLIPLPQLSPFHSL